MNKRNLTRSTLCLAAALALCLPAAPTSSQNFRRRLLSGGGNGSFLKNAWVRANAATSAAAVSVSIERSTLRSLSRNLGDAAATTNSRVTAAATRNNTTLALRGAQKGTISVSAGSLTRRKPISLTKTPAATQKVSVSARPGAKSSAAHTAAQGQELTNAHRLRKNLTNDASPATRRATGSAIHKAEMEAGAAKARADKAIALERQQFYKRQLEIKELAKGRASSAARSVFGQRRKWQPPDDRITTDDRGRKHALGGHWPGGKNSQDKSVFYTDENLDNLVRQAERVPAIMQSQGNFQRIVNAGRNIGTDRATGKPTPMYTVITNVKNNLQTIHPGLPEVPHTIVLPPPPVRTNLRLRP